MLTSMINVFAVLNTLVSLSGATTAPRALGVTSTICGYSAEGRAISAVTIQDERIPIEQLTRIAVICRQHGDEPETSDAGDELIARLTSLVESDSWIASRIAVLIIPVANPDGAERMQRTNSLGQDLNRDWGKRSTLEIDAISSTLGEWRPELVIDVHQWVPGDSCQTPLAESTGGTLSARVVKAMCAACKGCGFRLAAARWSGGGDNLCHRYWGISRFTPAILLETRHLPESPVARNTAIQTTLVAVMQAIRVMAKRSPARIPLTDPDQLPSPSSNRGTVSRSRSSKPRDVNTAVVTGIISQVSFQDHAIVLVPGTLGETGESALTRQEAIIHVGSETKLHGIDGSPIADIAALHAGDAVKVILHKTRGQNTAWTIVKASTVY